MARACEVGIRARRVRWWKSSSGLPRVDVRTHAIRPVSPHALTQAKREQIVRVANDPRFAELVVPAPVLYACA